MSTYVFRDFLQRFMDNPDDCEIFRIVKALPEPRVNGPWVAGGALRRTLIGQPLNSDVDYFFKNAEQKAEAGKLASGEYGESDRALKSASAAGLLPCPFCGMQPIEDRIEPHSHGLEFAGLRMPDYPGSWSVECLNCEYQLFDHESRENALKKWNRRSRCE